MKRLVSVQAILVCLYILFVGVVFRNWFSLSPLSAGDWEFHFPETLSEFFSFPQTWHIWLGNGIGLNLTFFMNLNSYSTSTTAFFHNTLGVPWVLIERLLWFWPYVLISSFSAYRLARVLFPGIKKYYALIASAVYTLNTYPLMLVGGGQMGVALSYSLAPLTFSLLVDLIQSFRKKNLPSKSIIFSLLFSFQVLLDIRIAYVTLLVLVAFGIWSFLFVEKKSLNGAGKFLLFTAVIPGVIVSLTHLWWILPFIFSSENPLSSLGDIYTSSKSIKFFSFADFSHAISLLQPNWPENIFGKTSFLKPEFLIFPILAFSGLFFIEKKEKRTRLNVLFLSLIALVGAFLAKGANEPLGEIYVWFFDHIPGFYMFRDPTKWYVIIALCYSALIPFALSSICNWLGSKSQFKIQKYMSSAFLLVAFCWLLFTILPAFTGQLGGTFAKRSVPQEYIEYKDFMIEERNYGRALWVPQKNRYAFYSSIHPNTDAFIFLETSDPEELMSRLSAEKDIAFLKESSIGYIVLPTDPYGEIFLDDRKYSQKLRNYYERELEKVFTEYERENFGGIIVYKVPDSRDLFSSADGKISWSQESMTHYKVLGDQPFSNLVFTSSFDPDWKAVIGGQKMASVKAGDMFNEFNFPSTQEVEIVYEPQKWVGRGLIVGMTVLVVCMLFLLRFNKRSK